MKKTDQIDGLAILKDSRVHYTDQDGFHYFYAENLNSAEYDKDSVQVQYGNTSTFTLRVGGRVAFLGSFTYSQYASEKAKRL